MAEGRHYDVRAMVRAVADILRRRTAYADSGLSH
jgi:hypothetical protein